MEPIYDQTGRTVGWLHEGVLYDRLNRYRAFVQADPTVFSFRELGAVFSSGGKYLGHLDRGFFRDRSGHAVAFVGGAHGGPLVPVREIPPVPPILPTPPMPPVGPPPPPPTASADWSTFTWDGFLDQ